MKILRKWFESVEFDQLGSNFFLTHCILSFQNDKDKLTCWLHLSFPGIYGHVVERLNTPSFIFLLGRIVAVQASPNWAIITRLCLARDMEFVTLIMKNFGAFIPGIRGDNVNVRGLSRPCGHLMCSKRCVPVADIHWPQVIVLLIF